MTVTTLSLLPGEQVVASLNDEGIVLTEHRIQSMQKSWGSYQNMVIFLTDISSIEVRYVQNIILLVLALISLLVGFFPAINNGSNIFGGPTAAGFIGAAVFVLMWWGSRRFVIRLTSTGGSTMDLEVAKISKVDAGAFVDQLQAAMSARGK